MKLHKKHIVTFACLGLAIPAILASKSLLPGGEIYLAHEDNNNFHVVEVSAKDLAHPFFGTSFHLKFNPGQYEYSHFSLGSYFVQTSPIVQVAQKGNEIIAGISLKRGSLIKDSEGSLLKLFFKRKTSDISTSSFSLAKGVFSTFDNGRKDIGSVKFAPAAINN